MADSEVRIQPSCSKCNSSHLQFMAERESGEVLNKPSAYVMIARHVADSDSSVAENTRECMHAGTLNKNYWIYLHLTTKAPQRVAGGSLWRDVCIFMPALMLLWSSGAKSKGKTFLLLCILVNTLLSPHAVFMCSQPHKQTVFNSAFFFFSPAQ